MIRQILLGASRSPWLARHVPRLPFVRRAVRRFVPGEDLESALEEAERLEEEGGRSVLTLLGENVEERDEAEAVLRHYLRVLEEARGRRLDAEVSVKLTQLGLDLDREMARDHLLTLTEAATPRGLMVWVDMESSAYTDLTLELYREARRKHPGVGICLQAYLRRTEADLESLLSLGSSIRLVKGAYLESPEVAFRRKEEVDANFQRLAARLLEEDALEDGARPAFGTHDLKLIRWVRELADDRDIPPDRYEIQMLYGIRREAQARLLEKEVALRVLISYGPAWFPWYLRRLAERPANLWFLVRNLLPG